MASRIRRLISPTLLRFLAAGGMSYLVNQASLYLLYERIFAHSHAQSGFDTALLMSSLIAVEWSIIVRFLLNDAWTFRGRCRKPLATRFYQFNLSSFGSPLISLAAVNLLTPWLGVSYLMANSAGILLGLAWNWAWAQVVWRQAGGPSVEQPESASTSRLGRATVPANSHR